MLETGEAQIAEVPLSYYAELTQSGFSIQKGAGFNTIDNIPFTGNYWDKTSVLTGAPLRRRHRIGKTWVGNPFENGEYSETTASMVSSMKVRNALARSIDRQTLLDEILGGLGFVNHQPYLSSNNPNFRKEWSWGTDYDLARSLLADAGYPDGFEMDFHLMDQAVYHATGEAISATWLEELNVRTNLIKAAYSTYRPGLVARTTSTPAFSICGDENKANLPYDWAHGFVVSSMSAGGYGVGQELPYAGKSYLGMVGEPDKAKREELAAEFFDNNRKFANCVGIFESPVWVMYDSDEVIEWDIRPNANGNQNAMNNYRSIKLAQ
jgi:ABC-type transport system substrate-binding protein